MCCVFFLFVNLVIRPGLLFIYFIFLTWKNWLQKKFSLLIDHSFSYKIFCSFQVLERKIIFKRHQDVSTNTSYERRCGLSTPFLLKAFKQMQPSKKGRDAEYTMGMKMEWASGRMIWTKNGESDLLLAP